MCAENIPADAVFCPYCGTQFEEDNQSALQPAGPIQPASTSPAPLPVRKIYRILWTAGTLVVVLILCGVISAILWTQRANLPVLSDLFATPTPTTTATLTPTQTPTETPMPRPSPAPTATLDLRELNPDNQHKYLYVQIEKYWHEARDYCALQGGHLVTIQDTAENKYIFLLTSGNTWLGATDEIKDGTWVWVTGEPGKYTNWNEGEPNNSPPYPYEDFLEFATGSTRLIRWNDSGDRPMFFVCEWEPTSP